jgi:hypothetical protein
LAKRGDAKSWRYRNDAWSIEKKSPPIPPVFMTSTSSPSGRTVMDPPPTSFSFRACDSNASPIERRTIITATPTPKPKKSSTDRHGR